MLIINSKGELINERQFREDNKSTSFPETITQDILKDFSCSVVFEGPQPVGEPWQSVLPDGVQETNGKYFTKFRLHPERLSEEGLQEQKELRLKALAEKRWIKETGEFAVNGVTLVLNSDTTNKLDAAYTFATRRNDFIAQWKISSGVFVTLDAETIISLGDAVGTYVQECFSNEKRISEKILSAKDFSELSSIDLDEGWPN